MNPSDQPTPVGPSAASTIQSGPSASAAGDAAGPAIAVRTDRRLIRAIHHSTRYLVAEVTAPPAPPAGERAARRRVNVAFVLDRSGSMGGRKIELARDAVRQGIERLAPTDRFAVIAYDDQIETVVSGRLADGAAKEAATRAIAGIDARGNTNLGEGWLRGAEQVAQALDPEAVNRVLLLTDGLANVGMTDPGELTRNAAGLRARGISTSTFGVGEDFDEALLGGMADAGGGVFRLIERPEEIPALIGSEVGELLDVTARDVALRISGAPGIQAELLGGFHFEPAFDGGTIHLGDLVADQLVRLVVAVTFPMGEAGREIGVGLSVADADGRLAGTETVAWRYADNPANNDQPRDRAVDRLVARAYADRALRDVVALNRQGRFDEARRLLQAVAARVRGYAGHDEVLREIVAELEREAERWSMFQEEGTRKLRFAEASYALHSRTELAAVMRRARKA